jgi:hypothetical protein
MERWYIIPRNKWFNIYLHKISRSDDDRALHDHRADNLSIVLKGSYTEIIARELDYHDDGDWELIYHGDQLNGWAVGKPTTVIRKRGAIVYRKAEQPHRIVVDNGPVWTLWVKFGDRRDWGFYVYDYKARQFSWMQWEAYEGKYGNDLFT